MVFCCGDACIGAPPPPICGMPIGGIPGGCMPIGGIPGGCMPICCMPGGCMPACCMPGGGIPGRPGGGPPAIIVFGMPPGPIDMPPCVISANTCWQCCIISPEL